MPDENKNNEQNQIPKSDASRDLAKRIADASGAATQSDPHRRSTATGNGLAKGLRFATEFVSGVVVGALLGWFFDGLLGTSPWIMVILIIVGFAAGVLNMVRAAEEMNADAASAQNETQDQNE